MARNGGIAGARRAALRQLARVGVDAVVSLQSCARGPERCVQSLAQEADLESGDPRPPATRQQRVCGCLLLGQLVAGEPQEKMKLLMPQAPSTHSKTTFRSHTSVV